MNTLNRYEMLTILEYLDGAERELRETAESDDPGIRKISRNQGLLTLGFIRKRLLGAAVGDVEVEPPASLVKVVPSAPASREAA